MWKQNKKILYAVSGGIAAYKAPDILHGWIKQGCEVETVLTKAAEAFVSPLPLSALSKKRVWREADFLSAGYGWQIPHISLAEWADVVVVAPCTANVLLSAASGSADTLLGALLLACRKPVVLFPAMNSNMLEHPATQANIEACRKYGYTVVEPDAGILACGAEGKGRLPSAETIYENVWKALCPKKDLTGKKVLVTAGPTHEYIDPVRYLSNPSSGKMGCALAKAAWYRGAEVTLVTGPCNIEIVPQIERISVTTAEEMYSVCTGRQREADIIIKAAAVGDFRAAETSAEKIKRGGREDFSVSFVQNKDIAAELGRSKPAGQLLIGFAAETNDLLANAEKKLLSKNLDIVVVNDVLQKDAGFGCDTNSVTIISAGGDKIEVSGTKEEVADAILDAAVKKQA